ncbi:MAG TPA: 3'-5' exonuclease [Cytophagales bacterium]|nr:3'-5' exonuclease [Cytophagales bacterium]HRG07501.1 3'-5' exonuclease [Cyclobacteriaceae bacterium]
MHADLKDVLFLDIETVRVVDQYANLNERLKTQWARKANFFKREEGQTDADLFQDRAGIYAEFGKIIVIGIGKYTEQNGILGLRMRYFADHDEKKLLSEFSDTLEKLGPATKLCAHNGKEFDFPYICRRALVNGLPIPGVLNVSGKKPWEVNHLDTMEMWKFGDYKHYTSLDLLAAIFEVPTSKGVMDGSMVSEVYHQHGDLNKIAEYCVGDVVAVAQLYLRMKGLPIIDQQNILYV